MLRMRLSSKHLRLLRRAHYFEVFYPVKTTSIIDNKLVELHSFKALCQRLSNGLLRAYNYNLEKIVNIDNKNILKTFFSTLFDRLIYYIKIVHSKSETDVCNFIISLENRIITIEFRKNLGDLTKDELMIFVQKHLTIDDVLKNKCFDFFFEF